MPRLIHHHGTEDGTSTRVCWNLTHRCNLQCSYCYTKFGYTDSQTELGLNDLKRVADQLHRMPWEFFTFHITGGEPTLHPELVPLMKHSLALFGDRAQFVVFTNGTQPNVMERLLDETQGVGSQPLTVVNSIHFDHIHSFDQLKDNLRLAQAHDRLVFRVLLNGSSFQFDLLKELDGLGLRYSCIVPRRPGQISPPLPEGLEDKLAFTLYHKKDDALYWHYHSGEKKTFILQGDSSNELLDNPDLLKFTGMYCVQQFLDIDSDGCLRPTTACNDHAALPLSADWAKEVCYPILKCKRPICNSPCGWRLHKFLDLADAVEHQSCIQS